MQRGFSRFKKQYSKTKIEVTFPKNTHTVVLNQVRSHIDLDLNSSTTMKKNTWELFQLLEPQCSHMYNGDKSKAFVWVISFARCFMYFSAHFSLTLSISRRHFHFLYFYWCGNWDFKNLSICSKSNSQEMFALGYKPRNLNLSIKVLSYILYSFLCIECLAYRKHLRNIYHHSHPHHHHCYYFCYYHPSIVPTMNPANTHYCFYYHYHN